MIDLRYKEEFERQSKIESDIMDNINKEVNEFLNGIIKKYHLLSYELISIMNSVITLEMNARLKGIIDNRVKEKLNLRNNIIKK